MGEIKRVMLDMDGVLVDFIGGINKCMGIPENTPATIRNWWENYNIPFKQVNSYCTINFWENLAWLPDGKEILSTILDKFSQDQIYLLTTPMPNSGSWTGKYNWIKKHLPLFEKQFIITLVPKNVFANSNTLLIDDYEKNIEKFIAAGGTGCFVPQSSNKAHFYANKPLEVVKEFLEKL